MRVKFLKIQFWIQFIQISLNKDKASSPDMWKAFYLTKNDLREREKNIKVIAAEVGRWSVLMFFVQWLS